MKCLPPEILHFRSIALAATVVLQVVPARAADLTLQYSQPAACWTEALPVGNGRLGAMIFGGVSSEHLQLNEATLWSGGPRDWNNPGAKAILPQVRAAIFAGDYQRAGELCKKCRALTTSPTSRSVTCGWTLPAAKTSPPMVTNAAWI